MMMLLEKKYSWRALLEFKFAIFMHGSCAFVWQKVLILVLLVKEQTLKCQR